MNVKKIDFIVNFVLARAGSASQSSGEGPGSVREAHQTWEALVSLMPEVEAPEDASVDAHPSCLEKAAQRVAPKAKG